MENPKVLHEIGLAVCGHDTAWRGSQLHKLDTFTHFEGAVKPAIGGHFLAVAIRPFDTRSG